MQNKLTKPAAELIQYMNSNDEVKDFVINWSRRGGKTLTAARDIIIPFAYYIENAHVAYITSTLRHAKDIVWNTFITELKPLITHKNVGEGKIVIRNNYGGNSIISLYGWQTIDSIRGLHNDLVVYDETQLLSEFFSYHNTAVSPTMATTKGRRFYLGTPFGFNHFYELMETAKEEPTWHYSEAIWEKFKHIDRDFIEKEKTRMGESEFLQEYECKFVKPDGLVFDGFRHDLHVYEEKPRGKQRRVIVGVDFGYGKGNTAILKVIQDEENKFWIDEEVYVAGESLKMYQLAKVIADMKPNIVYADGADPQRPEDLQRTGLPVESVKKHNNYKKGLIDRVNSLMSKDALMINKKCKNLLSEIGMLYWLENKDIVKPDNTTKHDAIDAMLYSVGLAQGHLPQERVIKKQKRKLARYQSSGL